jgi:hypothetical protein
MGTKVGCQTKHLLAQTFYGAGKAEFEYHPLNGDQGRLSNKTPACADVLWSGEGGSPFSPYAPVLIILPTGTTVKEALLIIDHRLKHPDEF